MKTILFRLLSLALIVLSSGGGETYAQATAPQTDQANISFEWAFGALIGKEKKFVTITKDTVLQSGEELKMMVKLQKDCFVYVVYYGSQGEVELLFPYTLKQLQEDYEVGKNYYIPKGREWMQLDQNTGKEKFFILASSERLLNLESLISEYYALAEPAKKKTVAEKIVSEIRDVRKSYATYATLAEKPITIGGNIRSTATVEERRRIDIADFAIAITAKNFYSKTFTIDHQ